MAERKYHNSKEREHHLAEVARLYLEGKFQSEIATAREVGQPQISRDLAIIQERWRASSLRDFDALKQEQLAKIDQAEREAWDAWQRSKQDKVVVFEEEGNTGPPQPPANAELTVEQVEAFVAAISKQPTVSKSKTYTRREGQVGDSRYLDMVLKCIERRCKLMGLDMPQRVEVAGPDGGAVHVQVEGNVAEAIANLGILLKEASQEERAQTISEYEHYVAASEELRKRIATVGQRKPVSEQSTDEEQA